MGQLSKNHHQVYSACFLLYKQIRHIEIKYKRMPILLVYLQSNKKYESKSITTREKIVH